MRHYVQVVPIISIFFILWFLSSEYFYYRATNREKIRVNHLIVTWANEIELIKRYSKLCLYLGIQSDLIVIQEDSIDFMPGNTQYNVQFGTLRTNEMIIRDINPMSR